MNNKAFIVVAIVLIIVALAANTPQKFDKSAETQITAFPKVIGNWQGRDLELSAREYEILETKNLFSRDYVNSQTGDTVNLYIIYSADNRRALHPPEVCYSGGGSTILEKSVVPISSSLMVNKFTIENKNKRQLVVYWYKAPNLSTYNYLKQQIRVVFDRLLRKKTYGAMIRIALLVKENDEKKTLDVIKGFLKDIEPFLAQYMP